MHGNALNSLRLVFASFVILSHAPTMCGIPPGNLDFIGGFAVDGFFGISGFLVAESRNRQSPGRYVWCRFLRIFPAFWVSLLLVAFVFSPIAAHIEHETWHPGAALSYVAGNSALWIHHFDIADTLRTVPFPHVWNSGMWTLFWQFGCYIAVGILLTPKLIRERPLYPSLVVAVTAGVVAAATAGSGMDLGSVIFQMARLVAFFFAGVTLWAARGRVRWSPVIAAAAAVVIGLLVVERRSLFHLWPLVGPFTFAYLVLWLGTILPVRVGSRHDISYGIYILAFPVGQVLICLGAARFGIAGFAAVNLAATIPLAWASWFLVERPALARKGFWDREGSRGRRRPAFVEPRSVSTG